MKLLVSLLCCSYVVIITWALDARTKVYFHQMPLRQGGRVGVTPGFWSFNQDPSIEPGLAQSHVLSRGLWYRYVSRVVLWYPFGSLPDTYRPTLRQAYLSPLSAEIIVTLNGLSRDDCPPMDNTTRFEDLS